jgi:cytochrome c-type biogenesis protein
VTSSASLSQDLFVCLIAGLLAFGSPCVVPLIPGYLAYLLGLSGRDESADLGLRHRLRGSLFGPMLFVAGFSVVFVTQGALFGGLGALLVVHARAVQAVAGACALALALVYSGLVRGPRQRLPRQRRRLGLAAAPILGVGCGLGWSPCLTPVLAVAVTLATNQATAVRGAVLMTAFCLGLAVPFLLMSLGLTWTLAPERLIRRHARAIHVVSTAVLVSFGLLMVLGRWDPLMASVRGLFA